MLSILWQMWSWEKLLYNINQKFNHHLYTQNWIELNSNNNSNDKRKKYIFFSLFDYYYEIYELCWSTSKYYVFTVNLFYFTHSTMKHEPFTLNRKRRKIVNRKRFDYDSKWPVVIQNVKTNKKIKRISVYAMNHLFCVFCIN